LIARWRDWQGVLGEIRVWRGGDKKVNFILVSCRKNVIINITLY
jgi:hypothetical protein